MRGTKVRQIRKMAFNYSLVRDMVPGSLEWCRHKNTRKDRPSFLRYEGLPRVYRDMKRSYTKGDLKI